MMPPNGQFSPAARNRLAFVPVFKRELACYLQSPGTYVALAFFFLLSGAFFTSILWDFVERSSLVQNGQPLTDKELPLNVTIRIITQMFSLMNFLMLLLAPALTMRQVAEEKRTGSFELLVTTPLDNWDILLGKYFAALAIGLGVLAITAIYPVICAFYSDPEPGVVLSCYLGLALVIAAYTAFGIFTSALTDSQIAAAILSFAGLLLLQFPTFLFKAGALGCVAGALSIYTHADNFTRGVVMLPDVLYFVLFAVFFLFLAAQTFDARKWRA
jgi:ABC-2 type transport system permease protein